MVGDDGSLYWFVDAYAFSPTAGRCPWAANHIRNSVKVIVNVYDGSVNFYLNRKGRALIVHFLSPAGLGASWQDRI